MTIEEIIILLIGGSMLLSSFMVSFRLYMKSVVFVALRSGISLTIAIIV
jgi:hypothetical protein